MSWDYFNIQQKKTFTVFETPFQDSVSNSLGIQYEGLEIDPETLGERLKQYKENYMKFGEWEPSPKYYVDLKKLSHFVTDVIWDDKIYITIATTTGPYGRLLGRFLKEEEANSMSYGINLAPRLMGKIQDNIFYLDEIISFDLILPTNLKTQFHNVERGTN
jgi:hypothetical protein